MLGRGLVVHWDDCQVLEEKIINYKGRLLEAQKRLESGNEDFTGWVKLPLEYDKGELKKIQETANRIRSQCDAFVVVGIGGSYLGARAAIEMLGKTGQSLTGTSGPAVYFAGQNISGTYHAELIEEIRDKELSICVISKSGTTTEPSIAFALLKDLLIKKYGKEEANRRIYAITDLGKGILREETEREGYESFVVPDDIGGRYSVLTAVGLLPIAVAGIDVEAMLNGAEHEAKKAGPFAPVWNGPVEDDAARLAAVRNELFLSGKVIEVYEYYEPKLQYFTEWLKQLFGESEGKEGKGIFPAALQFSTDLHSMGQFLQEGNQIFFETVLNLKRPEKDLVVPESAGSFLAGKSMNAVNQAAVDGVMAAHRASGIPMIKIDIPALTPYEFGRMVYFFERTCALSGYLAEVDPFNQPGVESYKAEMRKALEK
jgi:glucose-6-phosphate isomerase